MSVFFLCARAYAYVTLASSPVLLLSLFSFYDSDLVRYSTQLLSVLTDAHFLRCLKRGVRRARQAGSKNGVSCRDQPTTLCQDCFVVPPCGQNGDEIAHPAYLSWFYFIDVILVMHLGCIFYLFVFVPPSSVCNACRVVFTRVSTFWFMYSGHLFRVKQTSELTFLFVFTFYFFGLYLFLFSPMSILLFCLHLALPFTPVS